MTNHLRLCKKCGSAWLSLKWDARADRLKCTCTTCGYWWEELPLDAQGENMKDVTNKVGH